MDQAASACGCGRPARAARTPAPARSATARRRLRQALRLATGVEGAQLTDHVLAGALAVEHLQGTLGEAVMMPAV